MFTFLTKKGKPSKTQMKLIQLFKELRQEKQNPEREKNKINKCLRKNSQPSNVDC